MLPWTLAYPGSTVLIYWYIYWFIYWFIDFRYEKIINHIVCCNFILHFGNVIAHSFLYLYSFSSRMNFWIAWKKMGGHIRRSIFMESILDICGSIRHIFKLVSQLISERIPHPSFCWLSCHVLKKGKNESVTLINAVDLKSPDQICNTHVTIKQWGLPTQHAQYRTNSLHTWPRVRITHHILFFKHGFLSMFSFYVRCHVEIVRRYWVSKKHIWYRRNNGMWYKTGGKTF